MDDIDKLVFETWQEIKDKHTHPNVNRELGGLYSIAIGAKPISKWSFFATQNEKARYMVTKKYGELTRERAAILYVLLAKSI